MTVKYFKYPFGVDGDLLAIPNPTQLSGVVSYQAGYPIDYQLVDTDPASLNIQRNQFNQLMFDTTSAIQQLQQNGFPIHITAAMNDGVAYAYDKNSYVRATDSNVYYSLTNGNVDVPPSVNWQLAGSEVLQYFNFAVDTGVADHYVIAPNPPVVSYADGDFILLRAIHANTGACDIDVNSLGATPIKTMANLDPAAGMIIPSGAYILMYFGGNFVLCNPALGTAAYKNTGAANGNVLLLNNTVGPPYKIIIGSMMIQGGFSPASAGANPTITFATPFSAPPVVKLTGCGFGTGVTLALSGSTPVVSASSFGTQTFDTDEQGGTNPRNFYWEASGPV